MLNKCFTRPIPKKTLYELWNNEKPNLGHFHLFRSKFFVHNNRSYNIGMFDPYSNEDIIMCYSNSRKSYKTFNKCTLCIEESVHVIFDDFNRISKDTSNREYEDKQS